MNFRVHFSDNLISHGKERTLTELRRICGYNREEVAGGWRRPHNEELHNLNGSLNIISLIKSRRMRWTGHVARMIDMRNAYSFLVAKQERKRPLGRTQK
jgi:hypothetical protein